MYHTQCSITIGHEHDTGRKDTATLTDRSRVPSGVRLVRWCERDRTVVLVAVAVVVARGPGPQQLQQLRVGHDNEPRRCGRELENDMVLLSGCVHGVCCAVPSKQHAKPWVAGERVAAEEFFRVAQIQYLVRHRHERLGWWLVKDNETSRRRIGHRGVRMCWSVMAMSRRGAGSGVSSADRLTHPRPRLTLGTSTSQSIWQRAERSDAGSGE